ncbi:uncharacterized protein BCR38DRAFT_446704 [Pseudomassariella vexata]|uniref:Six-bladed beta-propeller-like protein n=1 Tax=Pseudomassariella vexata TaxID=1141098 RepID=A0A1Y2DHV5_9PEZI|nr:uncharacterized protein BCR38DRAFT_446704 [Pseudomassariella vexata]ORY58819.1 hypothetical protein BCR38DRAFT_446704 [Pseudomassariella vexata]
MIEDPILVTQLPSDAWFEGFALRPNGHILVSRLDQPELYTLDAENPDAQPELLHTFPDANGLINLCPLLGCEDEYAVLSGIVDLGNVKFENFIIWRVKLHGSDPPELTQLAKLESSGFCIGIMAATERTLLIADSQKHCIWRFDMPTGKTSVLVADETMKIASTDDFFGLNRLRMVGNYVWFTNTSAGILCRVPIELDKDDPVTGVRTTGPVETITDDLPHCDGLAVTKDQEVVYSASYMNGWLWKVNIDPETGEAKTDVVMENLVSPTAVELVYVDGKPKLFIVCCGEIDLGWINADDRTSWSDLAQINASVTVTVTTEEVVEAA